MFVDREAELAFLESILTRTHPGPGQLVLLYGRRRVGKTALLRHWAEHSGTPWIYWAARRSRRRSNAASSLPRFWVAAPPCPRPPRSRVGPTCGMPPPPCSLAGASCFSSTSCPTQPRPTLPCSRRSNTPGINTFRTHRRSSSSAAPTCGLWRPCSRANRRSLGG